MAPQVLLHTVTLYLGSSSEGRDPQARALWTEGYDSSKEAQMRAITATPDGFNAQLGIVLTENGRTWYENTRTIWR